MRANVFARTPDVYQRSPDSGELQYKSRELKTATRSHARSVSGSPESPRRGINHLAEPQLPRGRYHGRNALLLLRRALRRVEPLPVQQRDVRRVTARELGVGEHAHRPLRRLEGGVLRGLHPLQACDGAVRGREDRAACARHLDIVDR